MFDDDSELIKEIKKKKEARKKSFNKVINKKKLNDFEMDEVFLEK